MSLKEKATMPNLIMYCPACAGSGEGWSSSVRCSECKGIGEIRVYAEEEDDTNDKKDED
jgi:DnaJ-class molecular chaperone